MPARKVDDKLLPFTDRLGKEPDHVIAKEAGVSRSVVVSYRKRLGIDAYEGYKFGIRPGSPGSDKPRDPNAKPRRKPGRKAGKRSAPPAAKASASAGPTVETTSAPADRPARKRAFRGRRSKLDPYLDMLGKVADSEIAALAGVTPENVRAFRDRRGIGRAGSAPAAPKAPAKAAVSPTPTAKAVAAPAVSKPTQAVAAVAAPAAAARGGAAFSVQIDFPGGSRSYAVVAGDIAEAAKLAVERAARRHKDGQVKAVQKVADIL
jgi:hypothetical protein